MQKILWIAGTLSALLVVGAVAAGIHERHLSPEFHAQLKLLKKAIQEEEEDRKRQMDEYLAQQRMTNDRLDVENARLEVRIAELQGRSTSAAQHKLQLAEQILNADEFASNVQHDMDAFQNVVGTDHASSAVISASLPSHAHTVRDHLVLRHMKSWEEINTELSVCDEKSQPENCKALSAKLEKDAAYINAAMDGKY